PVGRHSPMEEDTTACYSAALQHNISYRWHSPQALQILKDDIVHSISDLQGAAALMHSLNLPTDSLPLPCQTEPAPTGHHWNPVMDIPFVPNTTRPTP
ncbi:Hypothetical predicted protein, partial [Pelobates cultripes]